jgi:hypothetical protein
MVYCSPGELKKAVDDAVAIYNRTPHESLCNVPPDDVYAGRKEVILQKRKEKKRFTMERRKQYNLYGRGVNPTETRVRNFLKVHCLQFKSARLRGLSF